MKQCWVPCLQTANLLIDFSVDGGAFANRYTFSSGGNLTAVGSMISAGYAATSGSVTNSSGGSFGWSTRAKMNSPSDGVITLFNTALNDFTRLQFGGTTSSFPSLARSTTTLKCRLADDSADAGFLCGALTASGALSCAAFSATGNISFFSAAAAAQQASGSNITNSVTSGGTTGTIANLTDGTVYANDFANIRNNFFQVAKFLKIVNDALRVYGLLN